VTTAPAMTGGRVNWGTPKTLVSTRFTWAARSASADVQDVEGRLCQLRLSAGRLPPLPVTTALIPSALLRFEPLLDGQRFHFTPSARGWVRLARVESLVVEPRFAAVSDADVLGAVIASSFTLTFPVASAITPLGAAS
jgi:hypothetical protein